MKANQSTINFIEEANMDNDASSYLRFINGDNDAFVEIIAKAKQWLLEHSWATLPATAGQQSPMQ